MKLTQKVVDGIGLAEDRVVWDDEAPGLGLRVQSGKRTLGRPLPGRRRVPAEVAAWQPSAQAGPQRARPRSAPARAGGADVVAAGRAAAVEARKRAEAARRGRWAPLVERYLADAPKRLRPASLRMARLYLRKHWQRSTTVLPTSSADARSSRCWSPMPGG